MKMHGAAVPLPLHQAAWSVAHRGCCAGPAGMGGAGAGPGPGGQSACCAAAPAVALPCACSCTGGACLRLGWFWSSEQTASDMACSCSRCARQKHACGWLQRLTCACMRRWTSSRSSPCLPSSRLQPMSGQQPLGSSCQARPRSRSRRPRSAEPSQQMSCCSCRASWPLLLSCPGSSLQVRTWHWSSF